MVGVSCLDNIWIVVRSDLSWMTVVKAETADDAIFKVSDAKDVSFVLKLTDEAIEEIKNLTK